MAVELERDERIVVYKRGPEGAAKEILFESTAGELDDGRGKLVFEGLDLRDARLDDNFFYPLNESSNKLAFRDCRFYDALFRTYQVCDASFEQCDFRRAELRHIMFKDCSFHHCLFLDAELEQVQFLFSDVTDCWFTGTTLIDPCFGIDTKLAWCNFSSAVFMFNPTFETNNVIFENKGLLDAGMDRRGYRFIAVRGQDDQRKNQGWYVTAGCRWLSLPDAYTWWLDRHAGDPKLRKEVLARLNLLEALIDLETQYE